MRLVEIRQHVAMALLRPIQFCQLLGDVGFQQQVLRLLGALASAPEVLGGAHVVAAISGDYSDVAEDLTTP